MTRRPWDKEKKYKEAFLKEYNHWVAEVSFRQHTLGAHILFAKRSIEKIIDLSKEELLELQQVMSKMQKSLTKNKNFAPDRTNYLQLGNNLHHLHIHAIPRYEKTRRFAGQNWTDKNWGHPPVWVTKEESEGLIIKIKNELLKNL